MVIDFIVNEVSGGWSPDDKFLRGTEDSVVQWAKRLAKDNEVTVFHNSPNGIYEEADNVRYANRNAYLGGADITINVKCSDISPRGNTLYFTNETNAPALDLSAYNGVIWPSAWAADNIPVNNQNVFIVPHGYDPELIYPGKKVAKQCFYASSPDRRLDILLAAWPPVVEAHPDATLLLTYGVSGVNLPGVICLGELSEEDMAEVYRTSDIWCHPCTGGELYCITGVKAQVSGCVPVIIPQMALNETVRHYIAATPANYAAVLAEVLGDDKLKAKTRRLLGAEHYTDWDESTDILRQTIKKVV